MLYLVAITPPIGGNMIIIPILIMLAVLVLVVWALTIVGCKTLIWVDEKQTGSSKK